ncbi:hypothetical protein DHW03_05550 [Pedobacter yonginense]|uniref:DUF6965 domain-containing protein n=1 Tax=Pedobacter yonginense TaxID=651869 RepID=A0A317ETQ8_9SPHI|nr:hypothetical protein [Pedobacter yonginense]PWS29283.1 hypothetical protein DHW03_05550 [Pedobacter yonginense]
MSIPDIQKLEEFFAKAEKPEIPLMLNPATQINDYEHFLESHFTPLKHNPTSKVNQPLLWRLKALKLLIESNA